MKKAILAISFLILAPWGLKAQLSRADSLSMVHIDTLEAARIEDKMPIKETFTQTSLNRIEGKKLTMGASTLGTPDLIKILQQLPGVSSGSELGSGLYVRGGDGSDNLFLLDGVPMYQISHLVGLFSSFNTYVIDNVDFYKGGFPARYGGRLSSVVDVTVRDGSFEEWHGSASIGAVDGHFQIDGPIIKGKTSLNFGVRRTYSELLKLAAMPFIQDESSREMAKAANYDFGDFNLKLTHKFDESSKLVFSGYYGQDHMIAGFKIQEKEDYSKSEFDIDYDLKWGNTLGTLRWEKEWEENLAMDLALYHTQYASVMDFNTTILSKELDPETGISSELSLTMDEYNRSRNYDEGLVFNMYDTRRDGHRMRWGANAILHTYDPLRTSEIKMVYNYLPDDLDNSREEKHYTGLESAAYFEDEIALGSRVRLNLGLRGVLFVIDKTWTPRLEPRLAAKWQLTDAFSLKGSFTSMNQFSHQVAATYIDLPDNLWMPSTAKIKPMHTNQAVLGGSYKFPFGLNFDVECFYKSMDRLFEYSGQNTMLPQIDKWEDAFEEGRGRAYGAEFSLEYENDKLQTAIYYTLSKSERQYDAFYYDWYPDRYDNRHKLTLTASYRFNKRLDVYAAWVYHSGNRFTAKSAVVWEDGSDIGYELYESPSNYMLPDYHRLDVGLNWHRPTRGGNERFCKVCIYNAYNHVNAMFGYVDESDGKLVGHAVGLIPIIPSISYGLRF